MRQSDERILTGGSFKDERGIVRFVNDFDLTDIKRFYIIEQSVIKTVRAWQGHKFEKKYFYVLDGEWEINIIKIENWEKPSNNLRPEVFNLNSDSNVVLEVPKGFVTGFQNIHPNSKMLIFSDKSLAESAKDDYRFDKNYFNNVKW